MRREREFKNMVKFKELLKNPSPDIEVPIYTKKVGENYSMSHSKEKITLKQVIDTMNEGFKQVNMRIDGLTSRIDGLETRIDRIEARIDRIDQRLDYNGLRKLPINNN